MEAQGFELAYAVYQPITLTFLIRSLMNNINARTLYKVNAPVLGQLRHQSGKNNKSFHEIAIYCSFIIVEILRISFSSQKYT